MERPVSKRRNLITLKGIDDSIPRVCSYSNELVYQLFDKPHRSKGSINYHVGRVDFEGMYLGLDLPRLARSLSNSS
jgi:hypothetical protein